MVAFCHGELFRNHAITPYGGNGENRKQNEMKKMKKTPQRNATVLVFYVPDAELRRFKVPG
jgi:hypothetical protein